MKQFLSTYTHIVNSAFYLCHIHPSACTCQSSSHWTDYVKFYTGDFHENLLRKSKYGSKSDKNIGHFTRNPKYIYVVESSMKYLLAQKQCKVKPFFCFYVNIQWFYTVDSYIQDNNRTE